MGIFGWSYPPGCSGPPEGPDPSPESEEVYRILEETVGEYDALKEAFLLYPEWTNDGTGIEHGTDECLICEAMRQDGHHENCLRMLIQANARGIDDSEIQKVRDITDRLSEEAADKHCAECQRRAIEAELEADKAAAELWRNSAA